MMQVRKEAFRAGVFGLVLAATALAVTSGCAKKPAPVPVTEWQPLADEYFPVKFEHPKAWHVTSEGPRVRIYSSADAMAKFHDPAAKAPMGVELIVAVDKQDNPLPLEACVSAFVDSMKAMNYTVGTPAPAQLDGQPALRVEYGGDLDKKTKLHRVRVFTMQDGTLYFAQYSAFNELYDFHAPVRDRLLSTFKIEAPQAAVAADDPSIPSTEMKTFSNGFLSIPYPANFDASTPRPKGEGKMTLVLQGYRQDSGVTIDVFPAKGLTVEKVFEQNTPVFKGRPAGESQISGEKAMALTYTPVSGVSGRAYFIVKNDQMYRIVVTWARDLQSIYLPVFEQMVNGIQLK